MQVDVQASRMHGELSGISPNPRPLSIEETLLHQIDRIGYLRSMGESWAEPVYHLRDLVVGLEDEEFWDGIPKKERKEDLSEERRTAYFDRGWLGLPIREEKDQEGNVELNPTPGELSKMLQIIMALLARRDMTWRRSYVDHIPMTFKDSEPDA